VSLIVRSRFSDALIECKHCSFFACAVAAAQSRSTSSTSSSSRMHALLLPSTFSVHVVHCTHTKLPAAVQSICVKHQNTLVQRVTAGAADLTLLAMSPCLPLCRCFVPAGAAMMRALKPCRAHLTYCCSCRSACSESSGACEQQQQQQYRPASDATLSAMVAVAAAAPVDWQQLFQLLHAV
jgi:hypothetical protein